MIHGAKAIASALTAVLAAAAGAAADEPLDTVLNLVCGISGPAPVVCAGGGRVWNVPGHSPTIQGGIDLAGDGDTVLVAPGLYRERLTIAGKAITLASRYTTTHDPNTIASTIVDGGGGSAILRLEADAAGTTVTGFTLRNGEDGVKARSAFRFLSNHVTDTSDGIDLSDAKGVLIADSVFEANSDDGIDFDGSSSGTIERNRIIANGDDGIEIRLHDYTGPTLQIAIRGNVIDGNDEDGIQLIDYDGISARQFRIHANRITNNAMVGLGMMADGNTRENFSGASIPEPIELYNNTFSGNPYAVTGGDRVTARNNIFANASQIALKNVDASSTVRYSLFWNNGTNHQSSNVDSSTTIAADPLFDPAFRLRAGSPAIDAGTNVGLPYSGTAPDLGCYESGLA